MVTDKTKGIIENGLSSTVKEKNIAMGSGNWDQKTKELVLL